jgi:hypothetical protein
LVFAFSFEIIVRKSKHAEVAAEKGHIAVILSEARDLSSI